MSNAPHRLITTNEELQTFCSDLQACSFITVDTEFMREKSYFPKLCLLQIAGNTDENLAAAIDPLAKDIDLSPVFALMQNPNIIKIFHAARQDIEIFFLLNHEQIPHPLFDTQIAAQFCGLGEQIGYETIASKLLGVKIDKSQRFTDWSQRPLSDKQIAYAITDVTHLRDIYIKLMNDYLPQERLAWLEDETSLYNDASLYQTNPADAWKRLKMKQHNSGYVSRIQALCQWREKEAIKRNVPRGWVLHDDAVQELALTNPHTISSIEKSRSIGRRRGKLDFSLILKILTDANESTKQGNAPQYIRPERPSADYEAAKDFLRLLLKTESARHNISPRLIASTDDITCYISGDKNVKFLQGWRYQIFGKTADFALNGEVSIAFDPKTNALTTVTDEKLS